jgi:hypothetical protein
MGGGHNQITRPLCVFHPTPFINVPLFAKESVDIFFVEIVEKGVWNHSFWCIHASSFDRPFSSQRLLAHTHEEPQFSHRSKFVTIGQLLNLVLTRVSTTLVYLFKSSFLFKRLFQGPVS